MINMKQPIQWIIAFIPLFSYSDDESIKRQFYFPCRGCGKKIIFNYKPFKVNCFTKGEVTVPKFLTLKEGCKTPHCEWSKAK